jgi:hypothetical protein
MIGGLIALVIFNGAQHLIIDAREELSESENLQDSN